MRTNLNGIRDLRQLAGLISSYRPAYTVANYLAANHRKVTIPTLSTLPSVTPQPVSTLLVAGKPISVQLSTLFFSPTSPPPPLTPILLGIAYKLERHPPDAVWVLNPNLSFALVFYADDSRHAWFRTPIVDPHVARIRTYLACYPALAHPCALPPISNPAFIPSWSLQFEMAAFDSYPTIPPALTDLLATDPLNGPAIAPLLAPLLAQGVQAELAPGG